MLCFKSIYFVAAFVYNYTSNIKNKVWFETNIDLPTVQSNNFSK